MTPTARPSQTNAPRSGVALLLGTYGLSAVCVFFLASHFDYEHGIVYRHLILIATIVLFVFSILLIVPRGVSLDARGFGRSRQEFSQLSRCSWRFSTRPAPSPM